MRMTNKIMQNNSLYNINQNKILQDKLSTNMATQKKLTRPSDDPIVAIRALRLRTSVSEITQFRDKNAKDADAWLTVTEDALSTAGAIIGGPSGLINQMTKAANKDLTPTDIDSIMQQIKSLSDELYATANVDYAGRYIFTGYRTDTPLSFTKDVLSKNLNYNITEQFTINSLDSINYTDQKYVAGLSRGNYNDPIRVGIEEQGIVNSDIRRLRLSYDEIAATPAPMPNITYMIGTPPVETDFIAAHGITYTTVSAHTTYSAGPPPVLDPYQTVQAMNSADPPIMGVVFVPETGELLFSDTAFDQLRTDINFNPNIEIRVSYDKNVWKEGDLRPEHYFAAVSTEVRDDGTIRTINYNPEYLDGVGNRQIIEYDVGYNQRIRINTLAEDVFQHTMGRNVSDLERAVNELKAIQVTVDDLRAIIDGLSEGTPEFIQVQKQLDAAVKTYDFVRENVHKMFENSITIMQKALDDINLAVTDSGTRSARLDLISNRLLSQKTTFEILKSENEDVDIAEVAIKLTSTELSYNAALMATAKIMQTSLMHFI
ncbi:MAG: hypothetical protein LBC96_08695 [Lachnospiraceae bacterium]|nr:hypothetical protein [Lachnospiraceae bacterium]